jgi:uncharacterized RDD family membrane protein YckC
MNASFYSLTLEIGRGIFNAFARVVDRDGGRVSADQADLIVVLLFVAIGVLLTAIFFIASSLADFGQILAVSG